LPAISFNPSFCSAVKIQLLSDAPSGTLRRRADILDACFTEALNQRRLQ
jgi:hypothetical protein